MRSKLARIRTPWRRRLVSLVLSAMVLAGRYRSPRARLHWVGHAHRPRRLERWLLAVLLLIAALIFEPREYLVWSIVWGGCLSLYLTLYSLLKLVPRKRYHWIAR